ncbi:MAG: class I SAM-dependent methyltransferase [Polyangiaceae bacterium]
MTETNPRCRSCSSPRLETVLDLGRTPLANALLDALEPAAPEETFPLVLVFCPECSLVQITETVPPDKLFTNYPYFSSYSDTMLRHASELAGDVCESRRLDSQSLVIEAASNDGYLLRNYKRLGIPVLGVEPAANVARVAEQEHEIPTLCTFFGASTAAELRDQGRMADVFHAHNVLAHVADLNGFVSGIATILKPNGLAVLEFPYVRDLIVGLEFDTIYHEHLCYFSLASVEALLARHGLHIIDVEHIPIHGGSLRVRATRQEAIQSSARLAALREDEQRQGLMRNSFYQDFSARVALLNRTVTTLLADLRKGGCTLAAYGASAKGATLLNTFGIGRETLDFVADRSPHKQGRYTPGTHLPIVSPTRLVEARPDYVLLLTWNFADEILAQQEAYRRLGGKFIVPLPVLRIV